QPHLPGCAAGRARRVRACAICEVGAAIRGWDADEVLVFEWLPRVRDGPAMTQGGAIETEIFPPAPAPAAWPAAGARHRVRLPGTAWSVWRDMIVRGTGFPADMMLAICDEPLARGADLAGADPAGRPAYDKAYADAAGRLPRAIAGI